MTRQRDDRPRHLRLGKRKRERSVELAADGLRPEQIALEVQADPKLLREWLHSSEGADAVDRLREQRAYVGRLKLEALTTEAVKTHEILMQQGIDPHVRMRAAQSVLDRVGLVRGEHHDVADVTPPASLEEARTRFRELGRRLGIETSENSDEDDDDGV